MAHKITANFGLKVVSLCLAILVWLVAISGVETETGIKIPVRYRNLSPGLTIGNTPPKVVKVTVAGPKILLWRLGTDCPVLTIDLLGAGLGNLTVAGLEKKLQLGSGLRIIGVYPSAIELNVRKAEKGTP